MKSILHTIILVLFCAACAASSATTDKITPDQARAHVGKRATVCGVVASANFATRSRRQPTFLNLDKPYPDHIFTAVIWIEDRPKFGTPETEMKGKRICVSGLVEQYQGRPQIILRERSQLTTE